MALSYRRSELTVTHPIPGYQITTRWGMRGDWALGYHTGDDYSTHGAVGIPVLASHGGRVVGTGNVWAGRSASRGSLSGQLAGSRWGTATSATSACARVTRWRPGTSSASPATVGGPPDRTCTT